MNNAPNAFEDAHNDNDIIINKIDHLREKPFNDMLGGILLST